MSDEQERDFGPEDHSPESEGWVFRLKEAVREAGGNKAVAQRSGVPLSTLTTYLAGRRPRFDYGYAIATACGVTMRWLLTGEAPKHADQPDALPAGTDMVHPQGKSVEELSAYAILPRYDVQASAGDGRYSEGENPMDVVAFGREWLNRNIRRSPKNLVVIEARGDSMAPTIRDGSLLIIDTSDKRPMVGTVQVFRIHGLLVVKRMELHPDGGMALYSDNTRYAPLQVKPSDVERIEIVGRVAWQIAPVIS